MECTKKITCSALILGICIALGPSIAGYFIYKGIVDSKNRERYVTVKGLVERLVKSDRAEWSLSFQISGDDAKAMEASFSQASDKTRAFLIAQGLSEKDMSISSPSMTDNHAQSWGEKLPHFTMRGGYRISSDKVDLVEAANRNLFELLKEGVLLTDSKPSYSMSTFNTLRSQMLAEATQNARTMAEQFAKDSASQVGSIRRVNQGMFIILDPLAGPSQEWSSGESSVMKKVRIVSTFDFFLQ